MDDAASHEAGDDGPDGERVERALKVFATLPPVQRSALALKDVLGLSLEETAATMGMTVSGVKAALSRARGNVSASSAAAARPTAAADAQRLRRYAELFNQRRWDELRTLVGEETRLDLVSRYERRGRAAAQYLTQYAEKAPAEELRAAAGWVEDAPVIAIFRPASSTRPAYFIRIDWRDDRIVQVRDFRYVPYISDEAVFTGATTPPDLRVMRSTTHEEDDR